MPLTDFLRNGTPVRVDGQTLSITAVVAAARHCSQVQLDNSDKVRTRVANSRAVISNKVDQGTSIYGVSTGFGGSGKSSRTSPINSIPSPADTRTDKPLLLGYALLQHQHAGILPSSDALLNVLPLSDPTATTCMPEAWVRLITIFSPFSSFLILQ